MATPCSWVSDNSSCGILYPVSRGKTDPATGQHVSQGYHGRRKQQGNTTKLAAYAQSRERLRRRDISLGRPVFRNKIPSYLIILLFTVGVTRLWKELFYYRVLGEGEKVLISRLAPGITTLDTICYLTSGPISAPRTPQAGSASWLFNLFSARIGILFK